uniref:Uncharacterized protein n=1 Tax=Anopheles albimanus TaxID=7167 RepID=A0A182FYJ0_ANOAL
MTKKKQKTKKRKITPANSEFVAHNVTQK